MRRNVPVLGGGARKRRAGWPIGGHDFNSTTDPKCPRSIVSVSSTFLRTIFDTQRSHIVTHIVPLPDFNKQTTPRNNNSDSNSKSTFITLITPIMAPVKLGIIGFGFATNCFHLPFILPNKDLEVYAFLQRAAPSAAASQRFGHCTDKFPQAKHYQTAEAFFADPEIEAVIVAAHNHEEFARSALLAGKHGTSDWETALTFQTSATSNKQSSLRNRSRPQAPRRTS